MKRLEGKKAIVTGGTRGIGRAIATIYVENGANVLIVGMNEERGLEACESLKAHKVNQDQVVEFRKLDVANHGAVVEFGKQVTEKWSTIDIIVNCAGITRDNLMIKISEEDWDAVLDTNLKSVYSMSHAFLRGMIKNRGGKIINITSVVGIMGNPGQVNYAASKSGMIGFTKSLAKEVASRNISINCIAPGFIDTEMTGKLNEVQKENILKQVPMGRLGSAKEIANVALFLASDESNYITGQVITVDGGMTA